MRKTLKRYFIPHQENNYHPHILHAKRAFFYGGLFLAIKIIVVIFALSLPLEVFVLPDVLAEEQRQMAVLVNDVRARNGLPPLTEKNILERSSSAKAIDMAANEYFSHTGPDNRKLSYFLDKVGYNYLSAGENLAIGFSDAEDIVSAWIKSPSHYANLIDPEFEETGFGLESGYYEGAPTVYIAQHLGWPEKKVAEVKVARVEKKVAGISPQVVTSTAPTTTLAGVIKIGGPTPVEKYIRAERSLGWLTGVFSFSKNIYLAFIVFFSLALLLKIFIEIRKQHPHVILQTAGLIGLLVCLYLV